MNFENTKTNRETFRISESLSEWLDDYAYRHKVTKSNVIRSLLRELKKKDQEASA